MLPRKDIELTHEHLIANIIMCADVSSRITEGVDKTRSSYVLRYAIEKIREPRV